MRTSQHYPVVYGETSFCKIEGDLMGKLYPMYTEWPLGAFHSISVDDETKAGLRHIRVHISYRDIDQPEGNFKYIEDEMTKSEIDYMNGKLKEVQAIHEFLRELEATCKLRTIQAYHCWMTHASTGFYWFDLDIEVRVC